MIIDFPGKREDEDVIMVIRKHPIVYVRLLFIFLVTSIIPVTIFIIFWSNQFPFSTTSYTGALGYLGVCFFILYSLAIFLVAWLNEEFDIFILTNQRLVDITQVNFFKRTVSETQLRNIEDTKTDIHGIFPTLLNYGNVDVQTAAGDPTEFFIDNVHNPVEVGQKILNAVFENHKSQIAAISKGGEIPDKDMLK